MKIALLVLFITIIAAGALYSDTGGMLPVAGTRAFSGIITPEFYVGLHERGDVTWVRKYEGQKDQVWSLGTVNLLGYSNPWQYYVDGYDIFSGNTVLGTEFGHTDNVWVQAYTTAVTRRIPIFTLTPAEADTQLIPVIIAPDFRVDRAENSGKIWLTPWHSRGAAIYASAWGHEENGERPLTFRSRAGSAVVDGVTRANRTKFETTESVDQQTTDDALGASIKLGSALFSYTGSTSEYFNNVSGPQIPAGFNAAEPIRSSRFDNTKTTSQVMKASLPLGPKLALTGNWINRDRTHDTAGIVLPELLITVPRDVTSNLGTSIVNLRYIALPGLQLNAKYRHFDESRDDPAILSGSPLAQTNISVSRQEKEGELSSAYTGFKSTLLKASYNGKRITRDVSGPELREELVEAERPAVALRTDYRTFRLGARTYLIPNVTVRADWKKDRIKHPSFHGTPSSSRDLNTGITYSPKDDFSVYADYRRLNEANNTITTPTFLTVASPGGATQLEDYEEQREEWSGAKYFNRSQTIVLGLYKSCGSKLTLDGNYLLDKTNSRAFWILGTDPAYTPHVGGQGDTTGLPPELVPYNAKDRLWSAGATYALTPAVTLRSNLLLGRTRGLTTTDSLFRLVAPAGDKPREWQPISVNYWRASTGIAYRWSSDQQVFLQLEHNVWTDKIETTFDGKYTLVSIGLVNRF